MSDDRIVLAHKEGLLMFCPRCQEAEAYQTPTRFDFGTALRLIKMGTNVQRALWVERDYVSECCMSHLGELMLLVDGVFMIPYHVCNEDVLATDWEVAR